MIVGDTVRVTDIVTDLVNGLVVGMSLLDLVIVGDTV